MVLIVCFYLSLRFCWLLMKRFHTARYLAAKIGTNSGVFDLIGLLCCWWFMIWGGADFCGIFFNKCYFHRIWMISVTKVCLVVVFACRCWWIALVPFLFKFNLKFLIILLWFFLNLFWGLFLGYRRVVFSLYCGCFCINFLGYLLSELFDKQRHLAGNFFCVF